MVFAVGAGGGGGGGIDTPGVGIDGSAGGGTGAVGVFCIGASTGVGSGATLKLSSWSAIIAFSWSVVGIGATGPPAKLASFASSLSSRSFMSTGDTLGSFNGWITGSFKEAGLGG